MLQGYLSGKAIMENENEAFLLGINETLARVTGHANYVPKASTNWTQSPPYAARIFETEA